MYEIYYQQMARLGMVCVVLFIFALLLGILYLFFWGVRKFSDESTCPDKVKPPFRNVGEIFAYRGQLLAEILLIIDQHYGGVPDFRQRNDELDSTWQLTYDETDGWHSAETFGCIDPIAFHTKEQADNFLKNYSNRKKINTFYQM